MRFFKKSETVDSHFTFLDSFTGIPIDVLNPIYRIVHYEGAVEIVDVDNSPLQKIVNRTGEYVCNWEIPTTAIEEETYFIIATGTHPTDQTFTLIEDFFRILPINFFGNGNGNGPGGMNIKFTKA
jgi:hypothetical protein